MDRRPSALPEYPPEKAGIGDHPKLSGQRRHTIRSQSGQKPRPRVVPSCAKRSSEGEFYAQLNLPGCSQGGLLQNTGGRQRHATAIKHCGGLNSEIGVVQAIESFSSKLSLISFLVESDIFE